MIIVRFIGNNKGVRIAKKILKISNEGGGAVSEMHNVFYNVFYFLLFSQSPEVQDSLPAHSQLSRERKGHCCELLNVPLT